MQVYDKAGRFSLYNRPERRGVSKRRVIDEAKRKVTTLELAERLCPGGLRKAGKERVGFCPLHEDRRTPNFYVNPEKDVWFCFVCLDGDDQVGLARRVWGYSKDEVATAAAELLHTFGHEVPARPTSWFGRQERQTPIRGALEQMRVERVRRRLMRWIAAPEIAGIPDPGERATEAALAWDELLPIARMMVSRVQEEAL